jgi:hypothetical protein
MLNDKRGFDYFAGWHGVPLGWCQHCRGGNSRGQGRLVHGRRGRRAPLGYSAGYRNRHAGNAAIFVLVFAPRYRHQVLGSRHLERTEQNMRDVCADFGAEFREFKVGPSICT